MKVDVMIPTYKPTAGFQKTLEMLLQQTIVPNHIWIVNTEECYWNKKLEQLSNKISVKHIKKSEFDHGATRNLGASQSKADVILFMTDDATPADNHLIQNMLSYLNKEKTAAVYARQLPNEDCSLLEKYTRTFNYPEVSKVKGKQDIETMGIKAFFCSNVCAAYKRKIFEERGGFINRTIFNEDMIYCGGLLRDDYYVAYAAEACVYHSHNYGPMEQLRRNFDLGVSQADHPEIFSGISSEREGVRLVKKTALHFIHEKKPWILITLVIQSVFKFLGYQLGKHYKKLSKKTIMSLTMNQAYWNKEE
ncbi:MAG: glycosyltransferase [Lachnospiraceae bacterium]|nr:glycosyltransferase [Lachnospiraceae bacterium]